LNEQNFINNLFTQFGGQNEDSYGFLTSNMLLVGAKLYSVDPALFNPFENQNYMGMLRSYVCGSHNTDKPHLQDIGLSCLYFLFVQKELCLVKYFIEDAANHDLLNAFLRVAK